MPAQRALSPKTEDNSMNSVGRRPVFCDCRCLISLDEARQCDSLVPLSADPSHPNSETAKEGELRSGSQGRDAPQWTSECWVRSTLWLL